MVHSWATDTDDPTVMPRWGKIGKQKIEDAGTLYPKRMETVDDEIRDLSLQVPRQGQGRRQAVLPVAQPDAHAHRHPPLAEVRGDAQLEEWLDHSRSRHGAARRHRRRHHAEAQGHGRRRQHHRRVHHRQRHRDLHLAGRRTNALRADSKGTVMEGGFRVPASSAGRARFPPARSKTASFPVWTGSQPSSRPPAIRTLPKNCVKA